MPLLTDAHGHLQADRFNDDYQQVAQRARDAGMVRLLIPSYGIESSDGAFRIAPDLPWADLAIGIHPYTAVTDAPGRDALLQRATDPRVAAIGEGQGGRGEYQRAHIAARGVVGQGVPDGLEPHR